MLAIGLLALAVPAFRQWTLPPRDVPPEGPHGPNRIETEPGPITAETDPLQETPNA
jgi:hypothetical protein